MDIVLSSGFLAFARHVGAMEATLASGLSIEAVVGTSSGALVGALFQSGVPCDEISRVLSEYPPTKYMRFHARPWQGIFSLEQLCPILQRYLPESFEDLPRPFAVGVCDEHGRHALLHSGDLLSAVLASIAIPYVFPAVRRDGRRYVDGGTVDRTAVTAWRRWRPKQKAVVHVVERSRGREVDFDRTDVTTVHSPRSHAKFWSLGDFDGQRQEARALIVQQLAEARLLGNQTT